LFISSSQSNILTLKKIPFYIEKALDQIIGSVKNSSRLPDGSLLVRTQADDQSKKVLKQKLLGSYHVLVEKHKTVNSTSSVLFCSQLDRCSDEEIQATFVDPYVPQAYLIHLKEEGKLVPTQTVYFTF
jgi:hypothetical protein